MATYLAQIWVDFWRDIWKQLRFDIWQQLRFDIWKQLRFIFSFGRSKLKRLGSLEKPKIG